MLVVDDDDRSRRLLDGYLRAQGYEVRSAPDGPTALSMVREYLPDVVLLDVMMPFMTGYEVCERLKKDAQTRLCQVMMVTALDGTPDKVEGLDIGADDYVTKPVRREEFLAKVRALLRARRLLLDVEHARAALAERNEELQLKKTLAQTLVHDLKNPLAAVLGNLDLLQLRCAEEVHYLIDRGRRSASRMQSMVLDLLDIERLEERHLVPDLAAVDAADLVRAAIDEAQVAASHEGVEFELDLPADAWVYADGPLLRRVVDNLISNAVSHSPEGGTVELVVCPRQEGIEIAVSDTGPGIPEQHRETVFEKYAQLQLREKGVTGNRGLGLTFCRLAVEAQGGTIWIDEAPGGGACFRTVLPDAEEVGQMETETETETRTSDVAVPAGVTSGR
jgi:signal transduction histidine kinase